MARSPKMMVQFDEVYCENHSSRCVTGLWSMELKFLLVKLRGGMGESWYTVPDVKTEANAIRETVKIADKFFAIPPHCYQDPGPVAGCCAGPGKCDCECQVCSPV